MVFTTRIPPVSFATFIYKSDGLCNFSGCLVVCTVIGGYPVQSKLVKCKVKYCSGDQQPNSLAPGIIGYIASDNSIAIDVIYALDTCDADKIFKLIFNTKLVGLRMWTGVKNLFPALLQDRFVCGNWCISIKYCEVC